MRERQNEVDKSLEKQIISGEITSVDPMDKDNEQFEKNFMGYMEESVNDEVKYVDKNKRFIKRTI